jgi:hypothetical protein
LRSFEQKRLFLFTTLKRKEEEEKEEKGGIGKSRGSTILLLPPPPTSTLFFIFFPPLPHLYFTFCGKLSQPRIFGKYNPHLRLKYHIPSKLKYNNYVSFIYG